MMTVLSAVLQSMLLSASYPPLQTSQPWSAIIANINGPDLAVTVGCCETQHSVGCLQKAVSVCSQHSRHNTVVKVNCVSWLSALMILLMSVCSNNQLSSQCHSSSSAAYLLQCPQAPHSITSLSYHHLLPAALLFLCTHNNCLVFPNVANDKLNIMCLMKI